MANLPEIACRISGGPVKRWLHHIRNRSYPWLASRVFTHVDPLVNIYITIENHNVSWENSLEMVIVHSYVNAYQRVTIEHRHCFHR